MIKTTILFQTFKRPEACTRLIESIIRHCPEYYPDYVIVNDDSEHDRGISWGRNFLVSQAQTPYVLIIDDDAIFTQHTDIKKLEAILEAKQLDILGFECGLDYVGSYLIQHNTVSLLSQKNQYGLYDYVPNMFIARRECLLKHKWDESLKIGEHFAFFHEHYPNLKIDFTQEVSIIHEHITNKDYQEYRGRGLQYAKQYIKKKNIASLSRKK